MFRNYLIYKLYASVKSVYMLFGYQKTSKSSSFNETGISPSDSDLNSQNFRSNRFAFH